MKTHVFVALAATAALTVSSCGLKKEKITESEPIKVDVLAVADSSDVAGRTYSGTVATGDGAEVSFTIPGTVKNIYVAAGQKVAKGQLLAELKADNLENANNIALATLAEAQDAYNRFKQLHDANALADMKWVEIQNTLSQAQNAAEIARRALTDAKVYAPVSGTVAEKLIDVGQTVVPALPAFRVVALDDVKIAIPVPENEVNAMKEGQTAVITVDALGGRTLRGTLSEKGITANPLTRAYTVKFSVDNRDGSLLPGMICSVALESSETASAESRAIVLPAQSVLLSADNRNFVWLARDGKAERRFVETGDFTADGVVVTSGLARGDTVIIAGMQKVSTGTPVSYRDI